MSVFAEHVAIRKTWVGHSDLSYEQYCCFNRKFHESGVTEHAEQLPYRMNPEELHALLEKHVFFRTIVREEITQISKVIPVTHCFILTDRNGIVIQLEGTDGIQAALEKHNVSFGSSFILERAGINGISLSMQLGTAVMVEGAEHSLRMFADWTCLCYPIQIGDEIIGYLDLSVNKGMDIRFAAVLMERISDSIISRLKKMNPESKRSDMLSLFEQYQLTNRETEVGYAWLQNQSALQIATSLGITEGTVRNMLKKVYAKTKVGDKGQFFRKFMV